jgi:hypothetical protein
LDLQALTEQQAQQVQDRLVQQAVQETQVRPEQLAVQVQPVQQVQDKLVQQV